MTEHSPEDRVKPNQADFSAKAGKESRCEVTPRAAVLTSRGVQRNSELKNHTLPHLGKMVVLLR